MQKLLRTLNYLPNFNQKLANKVGFFLLNNKKFLANLIEVMQEAHDGVQKCKKCLVFTEKEICNICSDESRDNQSLCIVSDASGLLAVEKTKAFRGKYHILGGIISHMENTTPEDLSFEHLINRIKEDNIKTVLVALNPTLEGRATTYYIKTLLKEFSIEITTLGIGVPMGASLDLLDNNTIKAALDAKSKV